MPSSLVIVESPAKAKTINKYLGSDFRVLASVGHVKNLPKDRLGVDVDKDFEPEYDVIPSQNKTLSEIRQAAKSVKKIYLASDPDREGEAIAAHLAEELQAHFKGEVFRLLLFEITKNSILEKIKQPGTINLQKYEAQKARRVLDRLVGYEISPLLWKKVRYGLSAGRVQSVAVRLICEREAQIRQFQPEEYWKITATAQNKGSAPFEIRFAQKNGKALAVGNEETATAIVEESKQEKFVVRKVTQKERKSHPVAPFITSTLQQEAARKLSMSSARTMRLAQQLYEGVDDEIGGLITYMRTDSLRIAENALNEVREKIVETYGEEYCPEKPRFYKTKKSKKVQDAHEAVRPTSMEYSPQQTEKFLNKDQQRLYKLIWNRFLASQMASAIFDQTQVEIEAGIYLWRVTGSVLVFPGFQKVYEEGKDDAQKEDKAEQLLPDLAKGDVLDIKNINPTQHFTEPPPRYSQATLIKELEEKGIGRPSTFASIMETITKREYVERIKNRFHPTSIGLLVNDLLIENFPEILDVGFTANLEDILDSVEEGEANWNEAIRTFYKKFKTDLETAQVAMRDIKKQETPTDLVCQKCESPMIIKWGKNGEFLACSNYPNCKNTGELQWDAQGNPQMAPPEWSNVSCEKCESLMVVKKGRYGKFLGCSGYPDCKNIKSLEEKVQIDQGIACPQCKEGSLVQKKTRKGKVFYSCANYPKCKYALWNLPVDESCPQCQFPILEEKQTSKSHVLKCPQANCDYTRPVQAEEEVV